jgi:hypothetical protein
MPTESCRRTGGSDSRKVARAFEHFDVVQLRDDLPEHGLSRGEIGTVVHVFETAKAYLVEFTNDADGSTKALAELTPGQINPA